MIDALLRPQWMLRKEVRDRSKLLESPYAEFPSIVVILTDAAKPEEFLQGVEHVQIAIVLNDAKLRNDLESDLNRWVSLDSDKEASFSIDKSNHPIRA